MNKICFYIEGHQVVADKGTTILEVALENNIYIPNLCYYPDLKPSGVCRLCMVEVNDGDLVLSCSTLAENGMEVKTYGPNIDKIVRPIVELLIADHHTSCRGCPSSGQCELQKIMAHLHIDRRRVKRLRLPKAEQPLECLNAFLDYDPDKCICCGICVQTCQEILGTSYLYFVERGYGTKIAFFDDESKCECCRECLARCQYVF